MAIDSVHPDYARKLARWQRNRDAYEGEDSVKSRDRLYLYAPGGFTEDEYTNYKMRAKWYGATARTVHGWTGAVFQKEPVVEASKNVEPHMSNITLSGISAELFASTLFSNIAMLGRYGVLLDYNPKLMRPYWCGYPAECITKWYETDIDGNPTLSLVVVSEWRLRLTDNYEIEPVKRYRRFSLNPDGIYEVVIYEEAGMLSRERYLTQTDTYIPDRRKVPLDFIPFQFFGSDDLTPNISRCHLDGLVDVNYLNYRHSADYEHGLFLTGVPTPVVTGHSLPEGERMPIGSLSAWVFPNPEAKAYLLEYQGLGLQSHERAMTNDKTEMATLGARLLEEQPTTPETLGAVVIRHAGETGSLRSMANLTSEGLTRVLRWHHWWNGDTEKLDDERFSYTLNTDFAVSRLEPQEIQALIELYQAGSISRETLFWNLHQGEIMPSERTFEEEAGLIEAAPPPRIQFGNEPDDEEEDEDVDEEEETEGETEAEAA